MLNYFINIFNKNYIGGGKSNTGAIIYYFLIYFKRHPTEQ